MKKIAFILNLIFTLFYIESIFSQPIEIVDSVKIDERYKNISETAFVIEMIFS